jgi:5-methylcytosine-specific restriction enzyme A
MNLSKIELQEMLREMGLKFSAAASYDELRQMFQDENHRRWLGQNRPDGPKRVIRRRRTQPAMAPEDPPPTAAEQNLDKLEPSPPIQADRRPGTTKFRPRRELPARRLGRRDDSPVVDRQQNVFATVLRRAKRCCELCDAATPEVGVQTSPQGKGFLSPFYIIPLSEGGQEVIKNVVALCPECLRKLEAQPAAADLKTLKRKARQKVISSVVVIRR